MQNSWSFQQQPSNLTEENCDESIRNLLLNKKDLIAESFLNQLLNEEAVNVPGELADDEKNLIISRRVESRLHSMGSTLVLKLNPLMRSMLLYRENLQSEQELATISVKQVSLKEKCLIYRRMFFNFIDAVGCVCFKVSNRRFLGQLSEREVFILTMFVFATCKRSRSDGMLMLYVSGISSCGKSRLIENVLLKTAHQLVSSSKAEAGVGRFNVDSKNLILLHDVPVSHLFGCDNERVKSLARGEATVVKVHSSTQVIHPCFLLVTSNERLNSFNVPSANSRCLPVHLPSHAEAVGKKRIRKENYEAITSRFLEMHTHHVCHQEDVDLRNSDSFEKTHLILGLFDYVIQIMQKHEAGAFNSEHFYHYVISGLKKNYDLYSNTFECDKFSKSLLDLQSKYNVFQA